MISSFFIERGARALLLFLEKGLPIASFFSKVSIIYASLL